MNKKLALIIGINNYSDRYQLNFCINDAVDVGEALKSIRFNVTLKKDCNKAEFEDEVNKFISKIQPHDLVFFYFAGHGYQFDDKNHLLPAGYIYDQSMNEQKFIGNNSISAQNILHRIERQKPYAIIFILDCCRTSNRTRSINNQQTFSGYSERSEFLIIFSCESGRGAIDETLNNRNGIFVGYLLNYLTMRNEDIESIIQKTGKDMKSNGYSMPERHSSLTDKIYLNSTIAGTSSIDPIQIKSSRRSNVHNDGMFPAIEHASRHSSMSGRPSQPTISIESISLDNMHTQRQSSLSKHKEKFNKSTDDRLIGLSTSRVSDKKYSLHESTAQLTNRSDYHNDNRQSCTGPLVSKLLETDDSSDSDSDDDDDSISSLSHTQLHPSDIPVKIVPLVKKKITSIPSSAPSQTVCENTDLSSTVHIRSLCQSYRVRITNNTTMHDLINIIWREVKFTKERYTKDTYVLLLFNLRLHIFVNNDPNTLVKDFLLLSPSSSQSKRDSVDFYVYGLPREHASSMYDIHQDYPSVFGNPNSWYPMYFEDSKQCERSQSILLCSLYVLRLYFRTDIQELKAERLAMEAQFFLQLRKYMFPPAILAFKHAITGSMFYFEKSLLMDGLIQLLKCLCDPENFSSKEICDFVPLLFCWLLEKCNRNEEKGDSFLDVKLINSENKPHYYFQDPVTTSEIKRRTLDLEEFMRTYNKNFLVHHVDIRSLTLHLTRTMTTTSQFPYNEYVIYNPDNYETPVSPSIPYWTDANIKDLYKLIAQTRDYRSFHIITRADITADVKNQLVFLEKDRTVGLLFSEQKEIRPGGRTRQDVEHFLKIFNPLMCNSEKPNILVKFHDILDKADDPRMPLHLQYDRNVFTIDHSFSNNATSNRAHQVTIILLDRSRSMSDYRVVSSDTTRGSTHIDICKIMLGTLSDNILSTNEIHTFGLIEFATNVRTVCPITQNREYFEKALTNSDPCDNNWTCIYDAIHEATRQIKTFTNSPIRVENDCKKLIICLSDGIDNHSEITLSKLTDEIRRNKIVVDFVSFIRDDQLKNNEVKKAEAFRKLCTDSGGYIYQRLYTQSDIELAAIFEQEAAVWLSKRSRTSHSVVDKPERYIPPMFEEAAVRDPPSNGSLKNSSRLRRIWNESEDILDSPMDNISVFVVRNQINYWKVVLEGPSKTPYQGRLWMLYVEFDSNYPRCPPNVRFCTPIYHVNISGDGRICHQILSTSWCQQTTMKQVFRNILDLLRKANFEDAISLEKSHLYKENPNKYSNEAEIHSIKNAYTNLEEMKQDFQLEDYDAQFEDDIN